MPQGPPKLHRNLPAGVGTQPRLCSLPSLRCGHLRVFPGCDVRWWTEEAAPCIDMSSLRLVLTTLTAIQLRFPREPLVRVWSERTLMFEPSHPTIRSRNEPGRTKQGEPAWPECSMGNAPGEEKEAVASLPPSYRRAYLSSSFCLTTGHFMLQILMTHSVC